MVRRDLACAALVAAALGATPAVAACEQILPRGAATPPGRPVTSRDLAVLRDIGNPDAAIDTGTPLAVSPDGAQIAFVISRSEPDGNRICRALVVLDRAGRSGPRIIDGGGELPQIKDIYRGMYVTTGFPQLVVPAWSPDGQSLAYLKRIGGRTPVWQVGRDGGAARQVTDAPTDVEDFAWSADGRRIIFWHRPDAVAGERKLDAEALVGYRYDQRVTLDVAARPNLMAADVPLRAATVDLGTGAAGEPAAADVALIAARTPHPSERQRASARDGRLAWTAQEGANPLGPQRVWVQTGRGRSRCALAICSGDIRRLWWSGDGHLLILRHEGWNRETAALYRWRPGAGTATTILHATDALTGCVFSRETLLCGRENATTPRRLVAIDTRDGRSRLLFDPNPEFATRQLGRVTRMRWTNDRGLPAWGDLVVPPDYDGRSMLPLVVVVYYSRGFLRGGIGDEYPIFPLAARGFAVLSLQRPPHVATTMPGIASFDDVNGGGRKDWAERRSILSAVLGGVDRAIARGVVDPARVGITGLSDGAAGAVFALINSRRFAAAAISSCCDGPLTNLAIGGTAWADWNHAVMGYPLTIADDRAFWRPLALSLNATAVTTPLLMQLADREAMMALETFAALREARQAVDLYVFPDEYHYKWQPAHRLAIYERNIDWFAYWLQNRRDPDPAKSARYAWWDQLRARRPASADDLAQRCARAQDSASTNCMIRTKP